MPWPRHLPTLLEALQVVPAALHLHWTAELGGHPVGHCPAAPVLASVRRRTGQRLAQLLLLLAGEHAGGTPRRRVLFVHHTGGPFSVVAFGDLPNPRAGVAGTLGNILGQLSSGQQPEDLPPRALMRLMRRSIALLQLVDAQVRRQPYPSHAPILSGPSRIPYKLLGRDGDRGWCCYGSRGKCGSTRQCIDVAARRINCRERKPLPIWGPARPIDGAALAS